ncbi:MAG TPA: glutamine--tRNA ligase/YqeY domain fusion protein [Rhodanobacteraceae bacterium]|nr:glutamine--tRNA ligase/YqeY domain fusion protein [Rhodanobacteraceae bacterium]
MEIPTAPSNFIRHIVLGDRAAGKHGGRVVTRFPPEPNGYLHLGHAKSICLNFGLAAEFGGRCNLRFDDTNPDKEDVEYVEAIKNDVRWLGFDWATLRHASDYFEVFHRCAEALILAGKAYVDDLDPEEMREYRGTLTEPGRDSPYRGRGVDESLDLFRRMRAGEFADGAKTLRARIDMASGNINLRDPAIYRIRRIAHQRTGDAWPIYPMYDYAHCVSDAIEGITHSLCTLEFEDHRPLYDWFLEQLDLPNHPELTEPLRRAGLDCEPGRPQQIEFARGNLDYTVMSKRKLLALVQDGLVDGWDDPRMPTLVGARRRGFPAGAIRAFWERAGVTKQNSVIEYGVLEGCVREELDAGAPRRMAVLDPLKLVLVNLPADHEEMLVFPNHPKNPDFGTRTVPFSRELWIERDDFMENPPKGFHRLMPGGEVRLRGVGIVRCEEAIKDADGRVIELHCNLDPTSRSGEPGAERKVKGTLHWVSARHALAAEVRLYDRLFNAPDPDDDSDGRTYRDHLNPGSKRVVQGWLEPVLADAAAESHWQFERLGYFVADRHDHAREKPVFNRSVTLRDSWARLAR